MESLPFESTDTVKVLTAIDLLTGKETGMGTRVLVMGGGLVGCETAVHLARQGKQVTISTRRSRDKLGGDIVDRSNRKMLLEMITEAGIEVYASSIPVSLGDGGVVLKTGLAPEAANTGGRSVRDELVDLVNQYARDSTRAKSGDGAESAEVLVVADSLVFAGRLLPQNSLAQEIAAIKGNTDNVFSVGDCVKVDSIMHAVWGGFRAVREIAA